MVRCILVAVGQDNGGLGTDFLDQAVQEVEALATGPGSRFVVSFVVTDDLGIKNNNPLAKASGFQGLAHFVVSDELDKFGWLSLLCRGHKASLHLGVNHVRRLRGLAAYVLMLIVCQRCNECKLVRLYRKFLLDNDGSR